VMFIHKNSQQMITINYNAVNGEEIVIASLAAACGLFVLYRYFEQIVALRRNPNIRFILCIVGWCCYMWCISGGMYNIIKGNIFAHSEKDKPTEYISGEPRDQYGAEGLILGFLNIAASSMLVLCNLRAFEGWGREGKGGGGAVLRGWLGTVWAGIGPALRPELCIGLVFFFWFYIVSIYSWKNRGYRNGFVSVALRRRHRADSSANRYCLLLTLFSPALFALAAGTETEDGRKRAGRTEGRDTASQHADQVLLAGPLSACEENARRMVTGVSRAR
jgi:hypothetical protein